MSAPLIQPEPERDRWGRYKLPHPRRGETNLIPWTRATTFAKSISDTYGLAKWQVRMAVKGMTLRPDLFALAASAAITDKTTLDKVADAAKEAAGTSSGANQGTALHAFTEQLDRGESLIVPPPWDADVRAYAQTMTAAQFAVNPDLIERIIVVDDLGVAGTFDRILCRPDGRLMIGDLKTGQNLDFGWLEIAIQLALYAHGDAMWNGVTGRYEPMPVVDKDTAIVMHLPVGAARCTLFTVDIAAGWEAAQLCREVRAWRTRRTLASPFAVPEPRIREVSLDQLLKQIADAPDRAELERLWQIHEAAWTADMTAAARSRLTQL